MIPNTPPRPAGRLSSPHLSPGNSPRPTPSPCAGPRRFRKTRTAATFGWIGVVVMSVVRRTSEKANVHSMRKVARFRRTGIPMNASDSIGETS